MQRRFASARGARDEDTSPSGRWRQARHGAPVRSSPDHYPLACTDPQRLSAPAVATSPPRHGAGGSGPEGPRSSTTAGVTRPPPAGLSHPLGVVVSMPAKVKSVLARDRVTLSSESAPEQEAGHPSARPHALRRHLHPLGSTLVPFAHVVYQPAGRDAPKRVPVSLRPTPSRAVRRCGASAPCWRGTRRALQGRCPGADRRPLPSGRRP